MEKNKEIKVVFLEFVLPVVLNDTKIAKKIYDSLPIESKVHLWGDEIYFEIPVKSENENSTLDVEIGDVGYWPEGNCFCIFFGRTPISKTDKPLPYSEVTLVGKFKCDDNIISQLKKVKPNTKVKIEKI